MLAGGRLTTEDAYAYAKFARVALGTNDIDQRVRDHSAEEESFLAKRVAGTGLGAVTYSSLEKAGQVLLVALEPEDECGSLFLRLRKGVRAGGVKVATVATVASNGSRKLGADTILAAALPCAWADMPKKHRDTPQFAVVSYGKLGGKELGYASDLDLVYLDRYLLDERRIAAALTERDPAQLPPVDSLAVDADLAGSELNDEQQAAVRSVATRPVTVLTGGPGMGKTHAIGQVLRKTSLDELPQLWNVLRGEMSLVGPRPVVRAELDHYGPSARHYLAARPGLTGLWQISGRSDTTYAERVRLDRFYVMNWNLWRDLRIIFLTIPAVALSRGAH